MTVDTTRFLKESVSGNWRLLSCSPQQMFGMVFVVGIHLLAFWALWTYQKDQSDTAPRETVFVEFIAQSLPAKAFQPTQPTRFPLAPPYTTQPRVKAVSAPVVATEAPTNANETNLPLPLPSPQPATETAPKPPQHASETLLPAEPVTLSSELSVSCPVRSAREYPASSRRWGEEGEVMVQVELDEAGHIASARIAISSGHPRLDQSALAAVRTWRCEPARREGRPVRADALQPFKFTLQGN